MNHHATQYEKNGLYELTDEARSTLKGSKYYNEDLAPTSIEKRTWSSFSICNLWIGLAISIPALALASSLVALGISPLLAILNVGLGNLIVLIPIQLNSHVGTKYGIPFPIFARLTFGNKGAQLPTLSRSIIACGWTSIQCWVGGGAVAALLGTVIPFFSNQSVAIAMPGNDSVSVGQIIGFLLFVLVVGLVAYNGMEKVKWVQNIGGPLLIVVVLGLFVWSYHAIQGAGYSLLDVFSTGNDEALIQKNGGFAFVYLAGLTGNIAYWSTMALNIPDFSRYAKDQKSQFKGQLAGMPLPMLICAFVGAVFAQATKCTMGEAMFDPTSVFYYMDNRILVAVCAVGVIVATLTTCVAANVVAPANGFSNLLPKKITFKRGVLITCFLAVFVAQPWWLYGSGAAYIFNWLNNYGMIIAPIAAILMADYFLCKQQRVDIGSLYLGAEGRYGYTHGWNRCGLVAWAVSCVLPLLGNTAFAYQPSLSAAPSVLQMIAANGYVFSFLVAFTVYTALMKSRFGGSKERKGFVSPEEQEALTKHDTVDFGARTCTLRNRRRDRLNATIRKEGV
ncbi:MAG: NCS1 family nucleobase:cation symporter-1 [Eubacteriales bacterium]|nr:NCS1 family nucleobase:cation symporter-1 [Eubacteriales bacterium]